MGLTKTEQKMFESIQEGIMLEQELEFLIATEAEEINYFLNLPKTKQYQIIKENKVTREEYLSELYSDFTHFMNLRKKVKHRATLEKKKTHSRLLKEKLLQEKIDKIEQLEQLEPLEPLEPIFFDT